MSDQKPYLVSARKYRPSNFRSVVGQNNLASTLKSAIASGRLAQAYLFCGPRGVGKTSCARIFAKTINCMNPDAEGDACGVCESCRAIEKGNSFDLVELDAASNNSVDDIRSITEQVNVPPQNGRYRVFIIDEVHMLSSSAFNAFLKTLEEPPANVVFILATTEKHKVIATILSRCQIYDFKRITVADMVEHLKYVAEKEGISTEKSALEIIASKADGAMRDALSIFDQIAASSGGNVTYESVVANLNVLDSEYYHRLLEIFKTGNVGEALLLLKDILDRGFDPLFFINGLASYIRDVMVAYVPATLSLLDIPEESIKKLAAQAKIFPIDWYYKALQILNDCDYRYRTATNRRLLIELTLIKLCQLEGQPANNTGDNAVQLKEVKKETPSETIRKESDGIEKKNPEPPVESVPKSDEKKPEPPTQVPPRQIKKSESLPPPTPTSGKSASRNRPQSFRINNGGNNAYSPTTSEKRKESFDDRLFMQGWNAFIDANPSLRILVNAMRVSTPVKATEEFTYRIVLDHPAQRQAFEMSMNRLLEFLRHYVKNDYLTLNLEINEEKTDDKYLPPKDFLKKIVTDNPELGRFLGEIEAEIV